MFQVGDKISVDKGSSRKPTVATIIEVEYRNQTYIAKVIREDNGKEDVFAWHIYQDEISVKKVQG